MNNLQKETIMAQVYEKMLNFCNKRMLYKVEGVLIVTTVKIWANFWAKKITLSE